VTLVGPHPVVEHYGRAGLADRILEALEQAGLGGDLSPADLAPVDEFHVRGREATEELALLAGVAPGARILDVGSGLGGPARHLAAEFGVEVVGVDLTQEYCDVAALLTERVGLTDRVTFLQGDALDLPFADGTFDLVWTQHAAMNIPDRARLYRELRRVLRPTGRLAIYDVTAGPRGEVILPAPWAERPEISFLVTPEELGALLPASGFEVVEWRDVTEPAAEWFRARVAATQAGEAAPTLGIHLLLGPIAREMFGNMIRNLEEQRIVLIQAVARAV
jgi:SAM-dependent methyltransferase